MSGLEHYDQFDLGQVTYNGFLFPPALNTSVQCTPVYDDTDRSIMYMMYRIRIEFIIDLDLVGKLGETGTETSAWNTGASKGSIDNQMAHLRRKLCQPGRTFHVAKIGLGPDLRINDPAVNYVWDVTWGPKPRMISWKPLGMNRAATVTWECEVGLVECENPSANNKERRIPDALIPHKRPLPNGAIPWNILQVYYNQSWDISETGATTKTYDAVVETRGQINPTDVRKVLDSADHYRVFFEPALQAGFRRTRSYKLDEKKTRLEISITDVEYESDFPLPPGVIDIQVSYDISSSLLGATPFGGKQGFNIWDATIGGTFTLAKGFHPFWRRIYPYYLILLLIRSRFHQTATASAASSSGSMRTSFPADFNKDATSDKPAFAIPLDFSMGEEIFGRNFNFSFTFMKIVPPDEAAYQLAFGAPPNQYAEVSTNQTSHHAGQLRDAGATWDWDLWLHSVYGTGNDSTNGDFLPSPITLTLHTSQVQGVDADGNTIWKDYTQTLPVLGRWGAGTQLQRGAPMSNRGFRGMWFEGDARQEPCLNNADFWYTRIPQGASASGGPTDSDLFTGQVENDQRTLSYSNQYEIYESPGSHTWQKTNYGSRSLSSMIGNSKDGYENANSATQNIIGTTEAKWTSAGSPDKKFGFNPCENLIDPDDDQHALQIQVNNGAQFFGVRMFGVATSANKPLPVPRQHKYGKAILVKGKSRYNIELIVDRGNTRIYRTMWDIHYTCVGSPSADSATILRGNPAEYLSQGTGSPASGNLQ